MTVILNLNILEKLNAFISANETRFTMQGVFVDPTNGCYVATDGHRLGAFADESATKCPKPVIVRVTKELIKASKEYRKRFPARQRDDMVLRLVFQNGLDPNNFKAMAKITHDAGDEPAIQEQEAVPVSFINGEYPSWLRVVPSQLPALGERGTMSVNAHYVETFGLGFGTAVSFFPCSVDKNYMCTGAILVLNAKFKNFFGLLMPMRTVHSHENELLDAAPAILRDRLGLKSYKPESQAA